MTETGALLRIESLAVDYAARRRGRAFRAVDGVSLDVGAGETLGLVGESGSGKSTIGKAVLGLVRAAEGRIVFDGEDITHCGRRRRRELTREIQVVHQDPYGSLNPVRTIGATLAEPLSVHEPRLRRHEVEARVHDALAQVEMAPQVAQRLPRDLSGGQRQRVAIARALIVRPRLIVCDEAVSALDLSVQAQVLNLLEDSRERLGVGYLFISHDLGVVHHIAARVAVLYRGRLVETDESARILGNPGHPYTAMLEAAAPVPDPVRQRERRAEFARRHREFTAAADAAR
ncbi:ABC transporter ATP-binding protein [Actinocorallia sp. A-T 12471]|uniref:ABC transporter ATP-binding protein n=1 Tax=Actinocorallia sp. A-T 12471 TaxID=3089813 RepID=UPI0029CD27EA|nr:ABC transporter ATP-binding protein [Actinocorallia sp. A-T 12471]MDX6740213.1 ABC transporter ATP-binding protein [Actinocorallia sp. A-T 12471]